MKVLINAWLLAWFGEIKIALGNDRMLKSKQMDLVFPKSTGHWFHGTVRNITNSHFFRFCGKLGNDASCCNTSRNL